ncbi:hypothetical protein DSO57_1003860 [Entomophthora muscae]|uniref:Uncharacterized protein n=1 Tax=Entomophthora muscae TaxID=34485 RepID=A0ACC2RN23_9FUNG|nr:hypothetical protein DSO57_1003860 [Entomophthora muscae]
MIKLGSTGSLVQNLAGGDLEVSTIGLPDVADDVDMIPRSRSYQRFFAGIAVVGLLGEYSETSLGKVEVLNACGSDPGQGWATLLSVVG